MGKQSVARQLAREQREGHRFDRKIFPAGFEKFGGAKLPLRFRREAISEIEVETKGLSPTQALAAVQRIVFAKWEEVVPAGADVTNFTYGPPSVVPFHDRDAQQKARRMLLWIPTQPQFSGALSQDEATVWALSFSGVEITQAAIAERVGQSQSKVSKLRNQSVKKLNERFRLLRDQDALPVEITAWIKTYAASDEKAADLYKIVEMIRRRERNWHKTGDFDSTGDPGLDRLEIRAA